MGTKTTMCLNLNLEVLHCRQATCKEDTTMRKLCLKMTERRFHLSLEMSCLKKVPEDHQDHLGISEEEDIDLNQLQKTKHRRKKMCYKCRRKRPERWFFWSLVERLPS